MSGRAPAGAVPAVPAPASVRFTMPPGAHADRPPEARGVPRDGVRLLAAGPDGVRHRRFDALPDLLAAGDLLVVNTSATLPAALTGTVDGRRERQPVHVGDVLDDGSWVVEVRRAGNDGPDRTLCPGRRLRLDGGLRLFLAEPYPVAGATGSRLWRAEPPNGRADPAAYLAAHGHPVRYGYVGEPFPLAAYQTVYAGEPGSAELVSAGRPLTGRVLARLVTCGVAVAPVVLHAGLSSPEAHEPPVPERYRVPAATARLVTATRAAGGRVVAAGTTVVRALESAAGPDGVVRASSGRTGLVLDATTPTRAVDALVTGLHEPEASHLALLEAVAGPRAVAEAYAAVLAGVPDDGRPGGGTGYLWHEFGDSMLLVRGRVSGVP